MSARIDSARRSRRGFLRGLLGGTAAIGVAQVANALPARAADNDPVLLGNVNTASTQTAIQTTGDTALHVESDDTFVLFVQPKPATSGTVNAIYGKGQEGGWGILGDADLGGVGVFAENSGGGVALHVDGKMSSTRCGVVAIPYPSKQAILSGPDIGPKTIVLATVQNNVGAWVKAAVPVPGSPGSFKLILNEAPGSASHPKTAKVAWFLLEED